MPSKPVKRGTLTEATPSPDLPAQTQNNSPARTEQPNAPAQATTLGKPVPSTKKK